jgi:hypothetical protein
MQRLSHLTGAIARDDACSRVPLLYCRWQPSQFKGGGMRAVLMSIEKAFVTYLEGMTLASQNAEPRDRGACRRR